MNRIKVRVWSIEDNKYLSSDSWMWHYDDLYLENVNELFNENPQYIWEQRTWLKDKNGKLIREGDIIQYKEHSWILLSDFIGKVVYDKWGFWFISQRYDFIMQFSWFDELEHDILPYIEVIWNVRENKDLLNKD